MSWTPSAQELPPPTADGWRGEVGGSFGHGEIAALASATCAELLERGTLETLLVASDGRAHSRAFADTVERVATEQAPLTVLRAARLPSPFASAWIDGEPSRAAIVITASHNAARWHGLKLRVPPGRPPSAELEQAIHQRALDLRSRRVPDRAATGPAAAHRDVAARIVSDRIAHLAERFAPHVKRDVVVVVDGLNGIAAPPMARMCTALGWRVSSIGSQALEDFGGHVPDPSLPRMRKRAAIEVGRKGADLGLVLDGDGDRLYALDELGQALQPQEVAALILASGAPEIRDHVRGDVLVTVATGTLLKRVAQSLGQRHRYFPIGFKNLAEDLERDAGALAAGAVGDIALSAFGNDRDPYLIVPVLGCVLAHGARPLSTLIADLRTDYGTSHLRWDECRVPCDLPRSNYSEFVQRLFGAMRRDLNRAEVMEIDGVRVELETGEWILVRKSTTESGIRIYGELDLSRCGTAGLHAPAIEALSAMGIDRPDRTLERDDVAGERP